MSNSETIVAAATAAGRGGIAIVRVSGPAVTAMLPALLGAAAERVVRSPRWATPARFLSAAGHALDQGLALYFPAPHSYTGEAVLELHGHGGPVLVEAVIRRVLELGARRAQPGEFTQRAYLNGKMDLSQAEAVASLIDAASEAAARAALRSLEGEFSRRVRQLRELIGQLRAYVEAAIDFSEEDIDFLADQAVKERLQDIVDALQSLHSASRQGRMLAEGMTVVIAGAPNAGKSTLLNRLAGHEAAIVTSVPGTTRDVLRERIVLDGLPLLVLDTAGLREHAAADAIEAEGMRRAREAMRRADRILFVVDAAADPSAQAFHREQSNLPRGVPVTLLLNKRDLTAAAAPVCAAQRSGVSADVPSVRLSALSGEGLPALVRHLHDCVGFNTGDEGTFSARARHLEALGRVEQHVLAARSGLAARLAPELVAEELSRAQRALGEILGDDGAEELLGRIFGSFCVGK